MMTNTVEVVTQTTVVEVIENGSVVVEVLTAGPQGPAGGGGALTPGPGFALVGTELRYAISTLSRG